MSKVSIPGYAQGFARLPGDGEPTSLRTQLRGYWDATLGNTGATWYDQSPYKRSAVPQNSAGWNVGQRSHSFAFALATNDYASIGLHAHLQIVSHWTIAARMRLTAAVGAANIGVVNQITAAVLGYWGMWINPAGRARVLMAVGAGFQDTIGVTVLQPGINYDLCGLWDGANLRIFVDGIHENNAASAGPPAGSGAPPPLLIGSIGAGGVGCHDQEYEYAAVWARDLGRSEIMDLHRDPTLLSRELED